jgi:hypothetical protein
MGTWGSGPFDNDAAADVLDAGRASVTRAVGKALRDVSKRQAGKPLDVEQGGAAWAACELVALAFGHGDGSVTNDDVLDLATRLEPREAQRQLALLVLGRIADRASSELAQLWGEGAGTNFDERVAGLRERLEAASRGPRALARAQFGDLIGLPSGPELILLQVLGARELAVFAGTIDDAAAALEAAASRPARRVPAATSRLLRRGRLLGNARPRQDLAGKRLYAQELGLLDRYYVASASGGGVRLVEYAEAREHDRLLLHGQSELRAIAEDDQPAARVRSPEEREQALRQARAAEWVKRRAQTTPGPFGDVALLASLVSWVEDFGLDSALQAFASAGHGRPREEAERRDYAFAGMVAVWRGRWPAPEWPARLATPPEGEQLERALVTARQLAGEVLSADAELRLMWGAELEPIVADLQAALA